MTIIDAIKKGLKAAGVNEKYAVKVQKLFKIEKEDDIDTYIALFKDNILPDLENTSAIEKAKKVQRLSLVLLHSILLERTSNVT